MLKGVKEEKQKYKSIEVFYMIITVPYTVYGTVMASFTINEVCYVGSTRWARIISHSKHASAR